jgi:hypothetical protein
LHEYFRFVFFYYTTLPPAYFLFKLMRQSFGGGTGSVRSVGLSKQLAWDGSNGPVLYIL